MLNGSRKTGNRFLNPVAGLQSEKPIIEKFYQCIVHLYIDNFDK